MEPRRYPTETPGGHPVGTSYQRATRPPIRGKVSVDLTAPLPRARFSRRSTDHLIQHRRPYWQRAIPASPTGLGPAQTLGEAGGVQPHRHPAPAPIHALTVCMVAVTVGRRRPAAWAGSFRRCPCPGKADPPSPPSALIRASPASTGAPSPPTEKRGFVPPPTAGACTQDRSRRRARRRRPPERSVHGSPTPLEEGVMRCAAMERRRVPGPANGVKPEVQRLEGVHQHQGTGRGEGLPGSLPHQVPG